MSIKIKNIQNIGNFNGPYVGSNINWGNIMPPHSSLNHAILILYTIIPAGFTNQKQTQFAHLNH